MCAACREPVPVSPCRVRASQRSFASSEQAGGGKENFWKTFPAIITSCSEAHLVRSAGRASRRVPGKVRPCRTWRAWPAEPSLSGGCRAAKPLSSFPSAGCRWDGAARRAGAENPSPTTGLRLWGQGLPVVNYD